MSIYIRCLTCKKAALREDRDAFIAKHNESCGAPRYRTFEVDEPAPKKSVEKASEVVADEEPKKEKEKSFPSKKKKKF